MSVIQRVGSPAFDAPILFPRIIFLDNDDNGSIECHFDESSTPISHQPRYDSAISLGAQNPSESSVGVLSGPIERGRPTSLKKLKYSNNATKSHVRWDTDTSSSETSPSSSPLFSLQQEISTCTTPEMLSPPQPAKRTLMPDMSASSLGRQSRPISTPRRSDLLSPWIESGLRAVFIGSFATTLICLLGLATVSRLYRAGKRALASILSSLLSPLLALFASNRLFAPTPSKQTTQLDSSRSKFTHSSRTSDWYGMMTQVLLFLLFWWLLVAGHWVRRIATWAHGHTKRDVYSG